MSDINSAAPTSIWDALRTWAQTLAPWQRLALRLAVEHRTLSNAQIDLVYNAFLVQRDLAPRPADEQVVDDSFPVRSDHAAAPPVVLDRVDGLVGVNAIPDGQALTFGEGLTVIYGRNGAGKTGFARLIANTCFSRHKPTILPNVHGSVAGVPAAQFHFRVGGETQAPFSYQSDTTHPALNRISFFDRVVADRHVTDETTFEFKPAGFDVFTEVVRVYGKLVERLERDSAQRRHVNAFPQSFLEPATPISEAVAALSGNTDLTEIRSNAVFGETEVARLAELDRQLTVLRTSDPRELIRARRDTKNELARLSAQLAELAAQFTEQRATERSALVQVLKAAEADVIATGTEQFRRPFFQAVGTPQWDEFARAAHALA